MSTHDITLAIRFTQSQDELAALALFAQEIATEFDARWLERTLKEIRTAAFDLRFA